MTSASELAPAELAALLHFYADSGCDWLLEDEAVDRIAEFQAQRLEREAQMRNRQQAAPQTSERPANAGRSAPSPAARTPAPGVNVAVPDADAVAAARQACAAANSLDALKAALEGFSGCNLKNGARSTVFASGDPSSGIMVIGPMPSAECDRDGIPFSGRPGQLLDRMLAAIGLHRDKVLLTNVVAWRPPGNRPPSPAEMDICRPFIERQIELAAPNHLLILGNFTARFFFAEEQSIFAMRGTWRDVQVGDRAIPAIASLHPQDLLTAPANKALAWKDLLTFRQRISLNES
ncbi:DNA polymerase [Rhizobium sp. Root149]|uniref:Type-4 uracil-DNA glycosylase n=1 Tax=Rhizobium rhizoryzae TaxID=451876 RepID=A0A7W6LG17_9HYPH|nr:MULTISPECIES: uracil-DNA glycosylase [Rhizobium]KQZ63066.1 DNA polymerase [Rhizobium sp. Root149]MBB4142688.1 DNA polymerase [Rhizobium rhizoryzae]